MKWCTFLPFASISRTKLICLLSLNYFFFHLCPYEGEMLPKGGEQFLQNYYGFDLKNAEINYLFSFQAHNLNKLG
jgi:hypothetical protein